MPSRTWAPSSSRKSRARPTTSRVTAHQPRSAGRGHHRRGAAQRNRRANPMLLKIGIQKAVTKSSRPSRAVGPDLGSGEDRPGWRRSHPAIPRSARWSRCDGEGREGRRHHGRRVARHLVRAEARRRHAVRQGLHLALHGDGRNPYGGCPRGSLHPDHRQDRSPPWPTCWPVLEKVVKSGKPLLIIA